VKDLRTLAADASLHFPNEFLNANPQEIQQSFVKKSQVSEQLTGA
jgi:hypothetical protein